MADDEEMEVEKESGSGGPRFVVKKWCAALWPTSCKQAGRTRAPPPDAAPRLLSLARSGTPSPSGRGTFAPVRLATASARARAFSPLRAVPSQLGAICDRACTRSQTRARSAATSCTSPPSRLRPIRASQTTPATASPGAAAGTSSTSTASRAGSRRDRCAHYATASGSLPRSRRSPHTVTSTDTRAARGVRRVQ